MKIYEAAILRWDVPLIIKYGTGNVLISNEYVGVLYTNALKSILGTRKISEMRNGNDGTNKRKISFMLDSGAFSAFTCNFRIPLNSYILDLYKVHDLFDIIVTLDVIGDPVETYSNFMKMQGYEFSGKIVPVWHSDADLSYLKKYLEMSSFICIGKLVPVNYENKVKAVRKALNFIKKEGYSLYSEHDNRDGIRVHLLGITDLSILKRFPEIYSADSSSWTIARRFAGMYVGNGLMRFFFTKRIKNHVDICTISNLVNDKNAEQYMTEYQHRLHLEKQQKERGREQQDLKH